MEVPLKVAVEVGFGMYAPKIEDPGALISTQLPKFEKVERPSVEVVAPTVIAFGSRAGEASQALMALGAPASWLPAATTTGIPASTIFATA